MLLNYQEDVKFAIALHALTFGDALLCHGLLHYFLQSPRVSLLLEPADMALLLRKCEEELPVDADIDYALGWLSSPALDAVFVEDPIRDRDNKHYV